MYKQTDRPWEIFLTIRNITKADVFRWNYLDQDNWGSQALKFIERSSAVKGFNMKCIFVHASALASALCSQIHKDIR